MVPAFVYTNVRPLSMLESQASSLITKSIQRNIRLGMKLFATRPGGSPEKKNRLTDPTNQKISLAGLIQRLMD